MLWPAGQITVLLRGVRKSQGQRLAALLYVANQRRRNKPPLSRKEKLKGEFKGYCIN